MVTEYTPGVPDRGAPVAKRRPLAGLHVTAEDDPRQRKTYPQLRQSLAAAGTNNVPIFYTADGEVIDGKTRVCAMLDLGMTECLGIELPSDWDEAKLLRFSIATDGVRRTLPQEELAAKAERYIDLTGSTQEAAAFEFGISPAHLSRALTSVLLPAKHAERAKRLKASVKSIIAAEHDVQVQDELVEFAATVGQGGKLPSRDAVLLRQKQLRGGKAKGRPKKHLEVKTPPGSVVESLKLKADASPGHLAQQLRALAGIADKHADDGMKVVLALIEGRKMPEPPAAPATA